jgi:hypothetical protein
LNRYALYTTIYPGMERFLGDWCRSVNRQDCHDFDIWIGVDGIETETVSSLLDQNYHISFVHSIVGDTPVSLRCRAMMRMVARYEAIIFTDSDDVLEPTRVSAALRGVGSADVYGCALGLMNVTGHDLGIYFGLLEGEAPDDVVPHNNFLGLSNTAWKSKALGKYLPVPEQCVAMDWLLATRAWGNGARIAFDRNIRMRYRQYGTNSACVVPPFSADQIITATAVVTDHYRMVTADESGISVRCQQRLLEAAARVEKFTKTIMLSDAELDRYVSELNKLPPHRLWWLSVAHPALEDLWNC